MNMHNDFFKSALDARLSGLTPSPDMRERVWEALAEDRKLRHIGEVPRRKKHLGRTLLIAAVFVLALSATAVGVYQYSLKDAVMEDVPSVTIDREGQQVIKPESRLSLNGFSDSPEYQAYVEWASYLAQWEMDNPNIYAERGMDDIEYETSENYAYLYSASFSEQGEKLDEIMAKYGLTLHTAREGFYTERQLCRALGIKDILSDDYDTVGEYFYDDGSFRLDAEFSVDGRDFWMTCVNAVKGSITMITSNVPEEYEQWTYTTAAGREVLMLSYDGGAMMIADLGGTYVTASFSPWQPGYGEEVSLTREQAEALVEGIDLETLADCFANERACRKVKDSIAAFIENRGSETTTDNMEEGAEIVLDILGNYYLSALPEGHSLWRTGYTLPDTAAECGYYEITHRYEGKPAGVSLSYRTLKEGETALEFTDPRMQDIFGIRETSCTVQGCDGILTEYNQGAEDAMYTVQWLDTDRELVFELHTSGWCFTAEEMLAFAESVTAEDPSLETGAAAYAARAARHQEEIDALTDASWAEYEAILAKQDAALQEAQAKLGDYNITELPEGYSYHSSLTNSVTGITGELGGGGIIGYRLDLFKNYLDESRDLSISLRYWRCWDAEDESISLNQSQFGRMREAYSRENKFETVTPCPDINGCEAFLVTTTIRIAGSSIDMVCLDIYWLDTDEDMMFRVSSSAYTDQADALTAEELIALAESVK